MTRNKISVSLRFYIFSEMRRKRIRCNAGFAFTGRAKPSLGRSGATSSIPHEMLISIGFFSVGFVLTFQDLHLVAHQQKQQKES